MTLLAKRRSKLSVVRGGTGAITLTIIGLLLAIPGYVNARTVYHGDGLILSVSGAGTDVTASWEDPDTGRLMLGASKIEDGFSSLEMISPSTFQKVAISGTGEDKVAISGTGEEKVAISGTGEQKVAISGTGEDKVAISGTGEDKSKTERASLEVFVGQGEVFGLLTIKRDGITIEHVFDFKEGTARELAQF